MRLRGLARDIGLCDQLVRAEPLVADRRDANAALQIEHAVLLDVLHAAHELEHLGSDRLRVLPADVLEQHDEFVAAKACDEVLRAHPVADLLRRELQQIVAGHVTARVVHVLELIEVDEEQRAALLAVGARHDLRLELRDQPVTVVEPRERIVVREMDQAPLSFAQRSNRVLEPVTIARISVCRELGNSTYVLPAASWASGFWRFDIGASEQRRSSTRRPSGAEQQQQHPARERKTREQTQVIAGEVEPDSHEAEQCDRCLRRRRIEREQPLAREGLRPNWPGQSEPLP